MDLSTRHRQDWDSTLALGFSRGAISEATLATLDNLKGVPPRLHHRLHVDSSNLHISLYRTGRGGLAKRVKEAARTDIAQMRTACRDMALGSVRGVKIVLKPIGSEYNEPHWRVLASAQHPAPPIASVAATASASTLAATASPMPPVPVPHASPAAASHVSSSSDGGLAAPAASNVGDLVPQDVGKPIDATWSHEYDALLIRRAHEAPRTKCAITSHHETAEPQLSHAQVLLTSLERAPPELRLSV